MSLALGNWGQVLKGLRFSQVIAWEDAISSGILSNPCLCLPPPLYHPIQGLDPGCIIEWGGRWGHGKDACISPFHPFFSPLSTKGLLDSISVCA